MIQLAAQRPAEAPVGVYMMYSNPPYVIAVKKSSGITRPKDLEGKTIGGPANDGALRLWPAFSKIAGIDTSKVKIENMAANLREQMLQRGQIDAAFGFLQTIWFSAKAINIDPANRAFYRDLFSLLGWDNWHEDANMLGMGVEGKGSFWFASAPGKHRTDYDQLGVNHLGIRAEEQKDVDTVAAFLRRKSVPPLFETPRHRPEFAEGEGQTYYQVMFTSPDNVLLEVVYIGPKAG